MTVDPEYFPDVSPVIPSGGVPAPVPAGTDSTSITDHDARLIADLVANIRRPEDTLAMYGVTKEDYARKTRSPAWMAHFRETQRAWNSDLNAQERIRAKAAFLLEDSLPKLHRIATGSQVPVNASLAAIETLAKISTVTNVPKQQETSERHSITINIGGDKPPVIITQEPSK